MNSRTHKSVNIVKPVLFLILAAMQIILYVYIIGAVVSAWEGHALFIPALIALFVVNFVPVILSIAIRESNHSVKLSRLALVLLFPLFGCLWYELFGNGIFAGRSKAAYQAQLAKNINFLEQDPKIFEELAAQSPVLLGQASVILNTSGFPVLKNTRTTLLLGGGDFLRILVDELKKARKFIFIECGELNQGTVFNEVFRVLEDKAQEELEIKLIYDKRATGSQLPRGFRQSCRGVGISCHGFGAYGAERNNRIMIVIDGNVAFSSTVSSLSDDLLDEGVTTYVLRGDAVWSCSVLFMNMWDALTLTNSDYAPYRPTLSYMEGQGYVAVFGDSPANDMRPVRTAYLKMISSAQSFVYIQTPSLEPDALLEQTLRLAAASGVDVRIVTAAPAAGALTGQRTRASYSRLLESGVKIFEIAEALDSKALICDDAACLIATASLDYNSLMRNHECAAWIAGDDAVYEARDDFLALMEDAHEITPRSWRKHTRGFRRIWYAILRALAPLA
ncbi:MAG: phosphatidylserine/phosphatidylglycerophosphate/cardiolipin synthase family protein [Defluviitaleaceae bacterium]|nr:phosphatidylserine/phosphatidylglycerophosphate/cardiolipin synthase family protein [Defluviitaleaceae bacterium]